MNHCTVQQKAFVPHEELRGLISICDQKDSVVCPKPLRVGILANNFMKPQRLHVSQTAEKSESKAGAELLDIILRKEDYGTGELLTLAASSPPFYSGSPPSRTSNPLVRDALFGDEKLSPLSPLHFVPSPSSGCFSSPSSASCGKGGCVRMKFGPKPAQVRVEGFDCLKRDRQNSSVPAMA